MTSPKWCIVQLMAVEIESQTEIEEKLEYILKYNGPIVCEVMMKEFAPIVLRIASKVMLDGRLKAVEFDYLYPFF